MIPRGSSPTGTLPGHPDDRDGPDSATTLSDLLLRCALDDEVAFDELYTLASPRIFGLVLRVVVDHAQAQEVTQDALTHIWSEAGRFDPRRGSAIGWMLTIAHRRAVDRVRSTATAHARDHLWAMKQTAGPHDSTVEAAHCSIEAARVRSALESLSAKQRAVIQLAYFGGLTHVEVATHLDLPLGTAKSRIRDGLRTLARALEGPVPST